MPDFSNMTYNDGNYIVKGKEGTYTIRPRIVNVYSGGVAILWYVTYKTDGITEEINRQDSCDLTDILKHINKMESELPLRFSHNDFVWAKEKRIYLEKRKKTITKEDLLDAIVFLNPNLYDYGKIFSKHYRGMFAENYVWFINQIIERIVETNQWQVVEFILRCKEER